jgi:preprotein translocase subunit YajC
MPALRTLVTEAPASMELILDFFVSPAWAQNGAQGGALSPLLFLIVIFVVFYFLLIRPQAKKQKEHREMVAALGEGDEVITGGGVLGRIKEVDEQFVTVEVANNVALKVQKHSIAMVLPKGTYKSA